tara:strand:- start:808 stop:2262 length:1455 start_codon:yes stop_codon:yes gene_type:complete
MTNLSDLLPAGAASKQLDFTASGTIAQGKPVVLNTNGTASQVAPDATSQSEAVGSEAVFESAETNHNAVAYGNGKLVIVYQDGGNSNYGTAVVATCSNGALTYGTPVVFESGSTTECGVAYDSSADAFVIGFNQTGSHVIAGSVSGTSISFGTKVQCSTNTSGVEYSVITYDSAASKSVIAWVEGAGQDYGYARTVSVSGTTATVGTTATLTSEAVFQPAIAYDSTNDRVVYMYGTSNGGNGRVNLITVSGTTLTVVASGATFASNEITRSNRLVHDSSADRMFLAYRESSDVYGQIGTISGNSISFGTRVSIFTSASDINQTVSYHSIAEKVVFVSQKTGDALIAIPCAVSGTTFSKGSEVTLDAQAKDPGSAYDENDKKVVVAFHDTPNNSYGTGISYTPAYTDTNLTSTNFLGVADAAISNAASGKITMKGGIASSGLSSLTPGAIYYVQTDGTFSTTAGNPSVEAGKAMSATSINLDFST